ncbi:uncharacterized protein JCM6883_006296 [Sporobolomyces salmoneus]|uniref:uncharacterized protein n=1 Tax=Sporobolomyces salmoneus TaxID=183962 RepID=UPI003173AE7C
MAITEHQEYPRKRARMRRANDGFWTPGMGEPTASSTAINPQATSTHSSPFAAPSHHSTFLTALIKVYPPEDVDSSETFRLRRRAPPSEINNSSISVSSNQPGLASARSQPQSKPVSPSSNSPSKDTRASSAQPVPVNSTPKAKAVIGDSTSPFWSNAGGIFQPNAQNPIAITSSGDDPALPQQLPNQVASNQPIANTPSFAGISALVFDDPNNNAQPTPASSPSPTIRRLPSPFSSLPSASSIPITRPLIPSRIVTSLPSTVTETRSTVATSSSLLLTTALVSASSSSPSISPSSSSTSESASSSSTAPASASSSNFFSTLGNSPLNITITTLVCVVILALLIAFLFIFIRRCQRRRKKRRLGDILGSEFGSPGGNGGVGGMSGMSEWATPGPGWTEKYYGEQIGGRMIGTSSRGHGDGSEGDEVEHWQRDYATGMMAGRMGMGMEGGYGVARTLSQERRTSEWANYRPPNAAGRRESWDELDDEKEGDMVQETGGTHVLEYGSNGYAVPAQPETAAVRTRSEQEFNHLLAPPLPSTRRSARPQPPQSSNSYSSYASESMYPVDEVGDIEAEKKELSDTMSALNLGGGGTQRHDNATSPPAQTSWRDSLDWVMGSAADLIGSKLLARNGSNDTLVASPPKKEDDRFTQRTPSIRIPARQSVDPLAVSDQFTPLSPSFGDRFLNPSRAAPQPPTTTMSRQSSILSLTSSANFATTNQQGTFAQSARSRLFDAAVKKHEQDEDEMEILDDLAAAMMSRQTTTITSYSEMSSANPPEIPYPRFDPTPPLSTSQRRFVDSPVEMSSASSTSTSSSFTYRQTPSPHLNPFLTPPEMRQEASMDSKASFDAFGRGHLTPREYHRRLSMSRERTRSKRQKKAQAQVTAREMEQGPSGTSISSYDDREEFEDEEEWRRMTEREDKARELMGERRRRSREYGEESLV